MRPMNSSKNRLNSSKNKLNSKKNSFLSQCQTQPYKKHIYDFYLINKSILNPDLIQNI